MRLIDSDETMLKLFKFDKEINMKWWRLLNDWNESIDTSDKIDIFSLSFLSYVLVETLAARLELGKSLLNMWWRLQQHQDVTSRLYEVIW